MSEDYPELLPGAESAPRRARFAEEANLDILIMSKDRACQLDALLRTIRVFFTVPNRIHILYMSSNLAYERGYDALRRWHPGIDWVEEGGTFRPTMLELLERIAAGPGKYLMPMVDDQIFIRPFTAHALIDLLDTDDDVLAVSLRLGENVTFCHPRNAKTKPPNFSHGYRWAWKDGHPGYWNYPMSVDANIYRLSDIADYWPKLGFERAETVEASMAGHPLPRPDLVCERLPCVLNLAVNRVQQTFRNPAGTLRPEALNSSFLSGFAIDVRPYIGRTFDSCHVDVEISLIPDGRAQPAMPTAPSSPGWKPGHSAGLKRWEDNGRAVVCAANREEALVLDDSALAIWNLCDATRTVDEIQAELIERFPSEKRSIGRDLRNALKRFTAAGLLNFERPSGPYQRLDLREIPCFVINCKQDTDKRAFMEEQLRKLGIPFEIVPGVRANPGWIGIALSHLKVLKLTRANVPFLVLEDDCLFNDRFRPTWQVPVEADALYLGVSVFGLKVPGQFSWGKEKTLQWKPYDPQYLRVFNMMARHAVVYLSPEYCESVIESQIVALTNHSLPYPGDIGCAMQHASHVVLTPNDPVCRQTNRDATAKSLRDI